ncbi:beta-lactamase family protein [Pseudomonas sp. R1-18]|uniref:serine hydrolase domain-containing protein n=1 Tax=Pseudomonas sp. R1-18 TaxID=1632772 RepID=UPI003DA7DA2E
MLSVDSGVVKRVDEVWRGFVDQGRIVGGVLLLAQGGAVRYASARGWADRENRLPIRRDTRFRLASLTKLLTSVAVLRLCQSGLLALDAPVTTWLPDFRPALADGRQPVITLRHLLSHTSGLGYGFEQTPGNAYQRAGVSDGLDRVAFDLAENLRRLAQAPLLFEPGSGWAYSLGTDVLGAVLQQAAGVPLPQVVARWVTEPLAMNATGFACDFPDGLALAYKDGLPEPLRISACDVLELESGHAQVSCARALDASQYPSAGAGMLGTADDYLRLLECLRLGGSPLLSTASTALLLGNAIGNTVMEGRGAGWKFGLGSALLTSPAAAGHRQGPGTWTWCGLYGCHYWVDPVAEVTLVALTNTAVAGAWGALADEVVEAIYPAMPWRF